MYDQTGQRGLRRSGVVTPSGSGIVPANGLEIAFETFGDRADRPLLMVMGLDPPGVTRQLMAIYASGDRTEAVRGIRVPTLVVHGDSDPLINVAAGRRTAELILGAELLIIPGMGHDLPRPVWPALADAVAALAERAERR